MRTTKRNLFAIIICSIIITLISCKKSQPEVELIIEEPYLTKWEGEYQGNSHYWISFPQEVNGAYEVITTHNYSDVIVNVSKSDKDSCLNLNIVFENSTREHKDLKISTTGNHYSSFGGGSSYGNLKIQFFQDSLKYDLYQKCGIPCNSGIDFVVQKN